jgi:hypothetical protein
MRRFRLVEQRPYQDIALASLDYGRNRVRDERHEKATVALTEAPKIDLKPGNQASPAEEYVATARRFVNT